MFSGKIAKAIAKNVEVNGVHNADFRRPVLHAPPMCGVSPRDEEAAGAPGAPAPGHALFLHRRAQGGQEAGSLLTVGLQSDPGLQTPLPLSQREIQMSIDLVSDVWFLAVNCM